MCSFRNDYSDGGHPDLISLLAETAEVSVEGYGMDQFSLKAAELLKEKIGNDDLDIHFVGGGTMANLLAISSFLRPHEAVISASSGHIAVHETGAIEACGHKVITAPSADGKLYPDAVLKLLEEHHFEHMVRPRLIYISQSTETGTLYSKSELTALRNLCDEHSLYLYIDGARLGSALCSAANDLSLSDIAGLSDAFCIGGTKNGALFGEALVLKNQVAKEDFRYRLKQRGGMLAKGRIIGIQFLGLFKDDLFYRLAQRANSQAARLQQGIADMGFKLKFHSDTNQIFPVFPEEIVAELEKNYLFYRWEQTEDGVVVRLICSWATADSAVDSFLRTLEMSVAG